jgi:hypothetical protein
MILIALVIPVAGLCQDVFGVDQFVEPGQPEAWGMSYATAATLFHGLEVPDDTELWDFELAVEISNIPRIDADKTRVGFGGTKLEDLNKSPVFGRGRLWLGLPADFTLELAYTPPVSIEGVRADGIYGIALGRPLFRAENWRLGARAFGQWGHAKGDITCSREVAAFGDNDFTNNPFGCQGPSRDDVELDHYGLEFSAAWQRGRWSPFLAWSLARIHPEVQINAPVFNFIDQSRLVSKDELLSGTLGIQYSGSRGMNWYLSGSWTPLEVDRGEGLQSDDFWSVHLMLQLDVGEFFGDFHP